MITHVCFGIMKICFTLCAVTLMMVLTGYVMKMLDTHAQKYKDKY